MTMAEEDLMTFSFAIELYVRKGDNKTDTIPIKSQVVKKRYPNPSLCPPECVLSHHRAPGLGRGDQPRDGVTSSQWVQEALHQTSPPRDLPRWPASGRLWRCTTLCLLLPGRWQGVGGWWGSLVLVTVRYPPLSCQGIYVLLLCYFIFFHCTLCSVYLSLWSLSSHSFCCYIPYLSSLYVHPLIL